MRNFCRAEVGCRQITSAPKGVIRRNLIPGLKSGVYQERERRILGTRSGSTWKLEGWALCYSPLVLATESARKSEISRHSAVVRVTHWLTVIAFFALLITGGEIVISHPRFYWGETGNVMTRPLFTLHIPASRDTVPTGYGYVMPDQNGWSRYLHFQAAWLLVLTGLIYGISGLLERALSEGLWCRARASERGGRIRGRDGEVSSPRAAG